MSVEECRCEAGQSQEPDWTRRCGGGGRGLLVSVEECRCEAGQSQEPDWTRRCGGGGRGLLVSMESADVGWRGVRGLE